MKMARTYLLGSTLWMFLGNAGAEDTGCTAERRVRGKSLAQETVIQACTGDGKGAE